jgi:exodeoxyribonuclease III
VIWRGQKTWNGVAILSKSKPIETLSKLPGDRTDTQSRYIEAAVNGIICCIALRAQIHGKPNTLL